MSFWHLTGVEVGAVVEAEVVMAEALPLFFQEAGSADAAGEDGELRPFFCGRAPSSGRIVHST